MDIHRDAATVIHDTDRLVFMDNDINLVAMTSQRLIDRVIHHLKDHMMQAGTIIGITNIHTRTYAHRF